MKGRRRSSLLGSTIGLRNSVLIENNRSLSCHGAEAANGLQGLELYRQRPTDLVITDIVMPEMNGLDMCLKRATGTPSVTGATRNP